MKTNHVPSVVRNIQQTHEQYHQLHPWLLVDHIHSIKNVLKGHIFLGDINPLSAFFATID